MSNMKVVSSNIVGYYSYKPDIEIKRYENGVEVAEKAQTECSICKRNLGEPSYETVSNNKNIFRETEITLGKCGHLFHSDCIDKWLKTCDTCPIDRVKWCCSRELDSTIRFILSGKHKYNKNNNFNRQNLDGTKINNNNRNNINRRVIEESDDDSENSDADY